MAIRKEHEIKTAMTAIATALLTAIALGGVSADAAGNPPIVNPLDINPFLVARDGQPCISNGSSVPLVGDAGQFYQCENNKWVAVKAFASPDAVPVGTVTALLYAGPVTPGYLQANGQSYDRNEYPDLAQIQGESCCIVPDIPNAPGDSVYYVRATS